MAQSKPVKVSIMRQEYNVRTDANPKYIHKVAKFVENQMKEIEEAAPETTSQLRIAVLAAMNVTDVYLSTMHKKNEAIDIRFEKRFDKIIFDLGPQEEPLYFIKPFIGIEATSDSAIYGLGGFYVEEKIGKNFFLTPNIGAGLYHRGDGKDLGSEIEFRSTIELSYQLKTGKRVGVSLGHISNASIGNKNPGTEILSLSYQTPF